MEELAAKDLPRGRELMMMMSKIEKWSMKMEF